MIHSIICIDNIYIILKLIIYFLYFEVQSKNVYANFFYIHKYNIKICYLYTSFNITSMKHIDNQINLTRQLAPKINDVKDKILKVQLRTQIINSLIYYKKKFFVYFLI